MAKANRRPGNVVLFHHRCQPLPSRCRPRAATAPYNCAGSCLGGSVIGLDARVGANFRQRLSGWDARTTSTDATASLLNSARKSAGAMDSFRVSAGSGGARAWNAIRTVAKYPLDHDAFPAVGNSGSEP